MKKFLLLFFLFTCALSSFSKEPEVEEGYIFIRVNEKFGDPFFMVYMEKEGKRIYVPIKAFLEFSEINTIKIDEEKKLVFGSVLIKDDFGQIKEEDLSRSYDRERHFIKNNDVFVELQSLKDVLNLKDLYWDETRSYLAVQLNYLLPFEVRELQEELQSELLSKEKVEEKIITPERKLFSPGVLRLEYFLSDFEDRDNEQFNVLYNTQLLYGDFYIQSELHPDQDLNQISLKYRDVIKDKIIILGDTTLEKDSALDLDDNNIRGFSITSNEVYTEIDSGKINIRGTVVNGTTVELYQGGTLLDLQIVRNDNEYNFEDINLFSFNDGFTLKFYYPNGKIEEREVSAYADGELQEKGESDYRIQVGESSNSVAGSAKYLYGLTDNITAGVGYLKAEHSEIDDDVLLDSDFTPDDEFNIAEGTLIMRSRASKNPALLKLSWLHDIDDGSDATFRSKINKQLWFLNSEFYYDDYSDEVTLVREEEKKYGALFRGQLDKFSYSLGYETREDLEGDEDEYSVNTRYYPTNNTRIEFNNTYTEFEAEDEEDEYEVELSVSYSGFESINLSLSAESTYSDGEWGEEEYAVRIAKKYRDYGKGDLDYSAEVRYTEEEWEFTAYITYYLQDWLSFPARFTEDDQEVGVAVEKTFILSRLFEENGNPDPSEAWVQGKVFKDENGNGVMDSGETPFEGIEIYSGADIVKTKEDGSYYIDGIQGNVPVDIAPTTESLDPLLRFSEEKYTLKPIPATGHTLNIPLVPIIFIMGEVSFDDDMTNFTDKSKNLQQVKIYIKDGDEIISSSTAEYDGFFIVEDIVPGHYTVEAKYLGQKNYEIKQQTYELHVESGETGEFYEGFYFELIRSPVLQEASESNNSTEASS